MGRSGNGEHGIGGGFGGAAGVSVASGAVEGWLIVVSLDRCGEDATGSVGESDALGAQGVVGGFFERGWLRGRRLVRS